nr:mechanosensitive ion channel family protein [Deltaproteobacteria bacterium]
MPDLSTVHEFLPAILRIVRIPLIIVGAYILIRLLKAVIQKMRREIVKRMKSRHAGPDIEIEKRGKTISDVLYKASAATLWVVVVMMVLRELGFDIGPILAGAGIVGLAVGFGAQNLVRDIISGLFLIIENQVRENDVAVINGTGGLVEEVNLRTTVLRSLDGTVHIFPNGAINTLSNMTRQFSYYVFDLGVAYKEDTDRVVEVIKEVGATMLNDPEYAPFITEPIEVLGVDKFADSAVIIKARIKTEPIKQWMVGRELNRRFKKRFDELGIEIPFPHHTLYFGEVSRPFKLEFQDTQKEGLREIVREVIRELQAEKATGDSSPLPSANEGK